MGKWVSVDIKNEVLKRDKTLVEHPIMFMGRDLLGIIYIAIDSYAIL